jgi:peptidoglycan hydrolase CwlO-like protein
MRAKISKIILALVFILAFSLPNFLILVKANQIGPAEERQQLEEELKKLEAELLKIDEDITKTEKEKKTLQNQIYILRKKIEKLALQIQQSNVMINDLGLQIEDTEKSINQTSLKIEDSRQKLANILQIIYQEDQKSLIEILISEKTLSGFFDNLIALETLNTKSRELLENIKNLKYSLEGQKQSLDEEKTDLENALKIQLLQKKESESTKKEKDYFLKLTETEYQKHLEEKEESQKRVAEIRARIYELIGIREAVTYEEALDVAKYAASTVGIRPALLLGVLSQESAIGKNVGQCFLKNPDSGAGIRVATGEKIARVMKPSRDVPYFLTIIEELNNTKRLAIDPYETLVSCPMSFGWGGAMGPAQFIPDTWANPKYGYKKRVEAITGNIADPWDIRDASLAASTYLKDGLDKYGSEGKAIQSYFCGYPKGDFWCSWYEKNVLYLTQCHQTFIDTGSMSLECQEAIGLK